MSQDKPVTTEKQEPMTTEGWKKLQEHNAWLQAELLRYQEAGCVAVAERLYNQTKRGGIVAVKIQDAIRTLEEALNV